MVIKGTQRLEAEFRKILAIINEQKDSPFLLLTQFVEKTIESLLEGIIIKSYRGFDGFEHTGNGYEKLLQVPELRVVKQKHNRPIVGAELLRQLF